MGLYKKFRKIVYLTSPDMAHTKLCYLAKFMNFTHLNWILKPFFNYKNKRLSTVIEGIEFENPIGLGAGFDKDGIFTRFLPSFSFGHIEVGSITLGKYGGNPKPWARRLVPDESIVINYGLKSKGAEYVLKNLRKKGPARIGVNVAATNRTYENDEEMADEFLKAYEIVKYEGDYSVINVSCPNSFGGENFCSAEKIRLLLDKFVTTDIPKPLFIKLKVDLSTKEVDEIIKVVDHYDFVTGFIVGNLTKKDVKLISSEMPKQGGLSGKPCYEKALKLIKHIHSKNTPYVIIGLGGVFSGEQAIEMLKSGASLVQLITGMIFEGPGLMKKINKDIIKTLDKEGFSNLQEALKVWHEK